jgi:uncharacterized damage-inducible protein DinB
MADRIPYTLLDTWRLNNRVNLMLLDELTDRQLAFAANPRGRSIAAQFAHLHGVRLTWLEVQGNTNLAKIGKGFVSKADLHQALESSAKAIGDLLAPTEEGGKIKGFRRGVTAFCGYLLAHEAHHRGQIIVHLKHAGMPVDPKVGYGIWEWEKI